MSAQTHPPAAQSTPRWKPAVCFFLLAMAAPFAAGPASAEQPITYSPSIVLSGSPVILRVALPGASAVSGTWLEHTFAFTQASDQASWFLLMGVDVEQLPGTYPLEITATLAGGTVRHLTREISVGAAHYRTTTIKVAQQFVTPDAAIQARIAAESALKTAAYAQVTAHPLWSGNFERPVPFPPTDSFGTRRTFNGTLASIHRGTDFRAPAGTPVYAANDGIVAMAQPMFYEGNFVLVDHGQQLFSQYMHFSRIDVHPGEHVHKGQRLGLSGATGRVTGPHLHFGIRWQGAYLDPVLLLNLPLPAQSPK